jgi:ABC-type multidrug transport system permease subunit
MIPILFKNKKAKGKILRVKQGYNPNSSSMGSIVFVLPAILFLITVIFGAFSGLLGAILARNPDDPGKKIGRFYSKLQNIFLKRKIKENLK